MERRGGVAWKRMEKERVKRGVLLGAAALQNPPHGPR